MATSCSIVPRSHSLAIVSEVSIAAMIDIITAIRPGTIMLRLSSVSLYQMRVSACTAKGRSRIGRTSAVKRDMIASAYPIAMVAVFASLPSRSSWTGVPRLAARSAAKSRGMTRTALASPAMRIGSASP